MIYQINSIKTDYYLDLKSLDAIFIDLDDTLVNYKTSCRAGLEALKNLIPELEPISVEVLEMDFREILSNNMPKIFDGEIEAEEERIMRLDSILKRQQKSADFKELRLYDSTFLEAFWRSRIPMEGAEEFLKMCKSLNLPIAVITNGNLEIQNRTITMLGFDKYIDALLTPEKASEMKPNKRLFERALDIFRADRNKTIMIGDSWNHDIAGAINTGIRPVWLNNSGEKSPNGHSVLEIRSLKELIYDR